MVIKMKHVSCQLTTNNIYNFITAYNTYLVNLKTFINIIPLYGKGKEANEWEKVHSPKKISPILQAVKHSTFPPN